MDYVWMLAVLESQKGITEDGVTKKSFIKEAAESDFLLSQDR